MFAFAHGAGAGIEHPFMADMAQRLAGEGIASLRYHFPYMEARALSGRRRPPDRPPVLVETVRAAVAKAAALADGLPLLAGGKSMGGRMTSTAAAEAPLPGVAGLVFLGFPLHAPGRPERAAERAAHLSDVTVPMLFLQGTRDALARLDLIEQTCAELGALATLHRLEGADHSFRVLKRSGRTNEEVADDAAATVARLVRPAPRSRLGLAERAYDGVGIPVDNREQNSSRATRNPPPLFPFLHRPDIEPEPLREFPAAKLEPPSERDDVLGSRVIDNPAGERCATAHMREHFGKGRLHLAPDVGTPVRHRIRSSSLIAATSRDSTFLSAGLRSSRSVFAYAASRYSTALPSTRARPTKLAKPAGAADNGRSNRVCHDSRFHRTSVRSREELANVPFVGTCSEDSHRQMCGNAAWLAS